MLCYGYISYQNQFFPYQIIKFFKQVNYDKINANYDKIRNEYKNWNKSNPNFFDKEIFIKKYYLKEIFIKKYYPGLNIFSNRHYFNHRNDEKLKGLYLVQIPRHYSNDIFLNIFNEIIIYRVLCEKNNNEEYTNWEKANYKLAIIGSSCVHADVVKKKFQKGINKITAGGPISSNPIFIHDSKSSEQIFQLYDKLKNN